METYCSIWVFLFCKHPMRAVLYKTNKPKSIYQDFGLFVLYNRAYGMLTKEQKIKTYSKPLGRPPKQQPPLILVEMAKAVSERNEVECSFRLWQENISCQQHKSKTARNCEMLDWYVLLCQKRDEVP